LIVSHAIAPMVVGGERKRHDGDGRDTLQRWCVNL
jgi:hypothetical protein